MAQPYAGGYVNTEDTLSDLSRAIDEYNRLYQQELDYTNALQKLKLKHLEEYNARKKDELQKQYELQYELDTKLVDKEISETIAAIQTEQTEKGKARSKELADKIKSIQEDASLDEKAKNKKIADEKKRAKKEKADELKEYEASLSKKEQLDLKLAQNKKKREQRDSLDKQAAELSSAFEKGKSGSERVEAVKNAFTGANGETDFGKGLSSAISALGDFTKQLDSLISTIAGSKTAVDTRLQGSKNATSYNWLFGSRSYWDRMTSDITAGVAVSPYLKQEDVLSKLREFVGQGIAYNVEQRAFLATISDKIATTFNAADGTLLRLIRLQQQDSTAARLGMESAITAFLNNMYENTEYLEGVASSVRGALSEAEMLMSNDQALAFEYQAQKWLGSLYSVGMSQNSISRLSSTIGNLASGNISGLTGDTTGNLVIMAANNAGLPISEILSSGLNASQTNALMQSIVEYLADIYDESKESRVLQQQYANIFGMTASELKAAKNLSMSSTLYSVSNNNLTYNSALQRLQTMANTMYQRVSIGQMMENSASNLKYSLAASIADSPTLYAIYKVAGMLEDVAGGIALPDIKVLGTGVNLQTSVADLMRVGALSGSLIKSIGTMIGSGSAGGFSGSALLNAFGVFNNAAVSRGTGEGLSVSGVSVSESGMIGNASGNDVYEKTMTDANDSSKSQLITAKEDEAQDTSNKVIDEHIVSIYELLLSVIDGTARLKVELPEETFNWSGRTGISSLLV